MMPGDHPRLSSAPVRVLVAVIPGWRVLAASRRVDAEGPLLVVDRGVVIDRNEDAAEEGVVVGLAVRAAQLRCPDAIVVPHDPVAEQTAFDEVVRLVEDSVAPAVHVVRPGVLAVRARGVARFHGGEQAAAERMLEVLRNAGHPGAGVAVADGLFAAELAARSVAGDRRVPGMTGTRILAAGTSCSFLSGHDVAVLAAAGHVGDGTVTTLHRLGLSTLGALAALEPDQVLSRFGEEGRHAHELSRGMDLPVLTARRPEEDEGVEVVLDEPLAAAALVMAAVAPAVERFMAGLADRGRVCSAARILVRATTGITERTWRQPWQFSSADLLDRVERQLSDLPRGDDEFCQVGVEAVRIVPTLHRAAEAAEGLFGARPTEHLVHVVSRLQERLGPEGVLVGEVVGGRMLKDRRRLVPFGTVAEQGSPADRPWPGHLSGPAPGIVYDRPRPARLETAEGVPLTTRCDLPSSAPGWFQDATGRRRVIAWAGPWPVYQRWWKSRATTLERWQLVTEDQQAWVVAGSGDQWWVEARYDEG